MPKKRSFSILLVEDRDEDIEFMHLAIKEISEYKIFAEIARTGTEAIQYLEANTNRPDFIILDWNLPDMTGLDVLKNIKGNIKLRRIPVIILSTSKTKKHVDDAYNNYCHGYVQKPLEFDELVTKVRAIFDLAVHFIPPASN